MDLVRVVGPTRAIEIVGVKLVGATAENGRKLLFSLVFVGGALVLRRLLRSLVGLFGRGQHERGRFWARQAVGLFVALLLVAGMASIWFDDPGRLATAIGLVTAGLAFALQRVVTALAGYTVILRGNTFSVGDRITMGGVRGDVVALSFIQTTIMEMGQPPSVEAQSDPAMWVRSRQYTGRLVTISNAKIFDEPVYNYTREFPYIWEEMAIPIGYRADRGRAEQILLNAARRHAVDAGTIGSRPSRARAKVRRCPGPVAAPRVLAPDGQLAGAHGSVLGRHTRYPRAEGRHDARDPGAARRRRHRGRVRDVRDRRLAAGSPDPRTDLVSSTRWGGSPSARMRMEFASGGRIV